MWLTLRWNKNDYRQRDPVAVAGAELGGYRTVLAVPMLKEKELIGEDRRFSRARNLRPFTAKQIELVSNFAAQAVIAIENARLLTATASAHRRVGATAGRIERDLRQHG